MGLIVSIYTHCTSHTWVLASVFMYHLKFQQQVQDIPISQSRPNHTGLVSLSCPLCLLPIELEAIRHCQLGKAYTHVWVYSASSEYETTYRVIGNGSHFSLPSPGLL